LNRKHSGTGKTLLLAGAAGILFLLMTLAGCSGEQEQMNWIDKEFNEIEEAAAGSTVNFYMWGGDARINAWIDSFVAGELEERYGIRLERVPMDASVFINKLLNEKSAGKQEGVIDLVWINGENFKTARENGLLYGSFSGKLPNFAFVDPDAVSTDFGYPVDGWESPYGKTQFVFEYDSAKVPDPPSSFEELSEWVRDNPGKFTYPQPPDFTGSAFIRQAFYAVSGGPDQYLEDFSEERVQPGAEKLWDYLRSIKPYLWQAGETYPQNKARLDFLFERGEVLINMDYNPTAASGKILDNRYPDTVRTFIMEGNSLANQHYVSIPFNAPNVPAALVTADFLLSPEAQYSKNQPATWGDMTVLDLTRLPAEWARKFEDLELGAATLPFEILSRNSVPEISAEYVEYLEKRWQEELLQ